MQTHRVLNFTVGSEPDQRWCTDERENSREDFIRAGVGTLEDEGSFLGHVDEILSGKVSQVLIAALFLPVLTDHLCPGDNGKVISE